MLLATWSLIAIGVCLGCCFKAIEAQREDDDNAFTWHIAALAAPALVLVFTSESTVQPIFQCIVTMVPARGTTLNSITAFAVTGLACFIFVSGTPLACLMVLDGEIQMGSGGNEQKVRSALVLAWPRRENDENSSEFDTPQMHQLAADMLKMHQDYSPQADKILAKDRAMCAYGGEAWIVETHNEIDMKMFTKIQRIM